MRCNIIAEIGWNHMGDMSLAKEMVDSALGCGADFVKFQTWSVNNLKKGEWDTDGRRDIYKKAELSRDDHNKLHEYVKLKGGKFLTSLFSHKDFDKLPEEYNDILKIPSTEITNKLLIDMALERFDHLIISTGASMINEVKQVIDWCGCKCTILHCVSAYPCDMEMANLSRIHLLRQLHGKVGYSDHTFGISAPAYAISHGCSILEKHFTTDASLPGRDNKFASTPDILADICRIRDEIDIMTAGCNPDYVESEEGARNIYRGRWCG